MKLRAGHGLDSLRSGPFELLPIVLAEQLDRMESTRRRAGDAGEWDGPLPRHVEATQAGEPLGQLRPQVLGGHAPAVG